MAVRWGQSAHAKGRPACAAAYFLFRTVVLPETKGRTQEKIEAIFAKRGQK